MSCATDISNSLQRRYIIFSICIHTCCTCPGINILTTHENWNLLACFIFMTRGVYFIVLRYHVSPSCANYRNDSDVVAVRLLLEWKKRRKKKKQEACNREKSYKRKIAKKKGKIVIRCFIVYRFEHRYAQFMVDLPVDRISRALPH